MKYLPLILIILLTGCFGMNRTIDNGLSQQQKQDIVKSQNQTLEVSQPPSKKVDLTISGNSSAPITINFGEDKPIEQKQSTSTSANINTSGSIVETEKVVQRNPFTLIYWGIGSFIVLITLIILVFWIKKQLGIISYNGGGIALDSVKRWVEQKMVGNVNETKQDIYNEILSEVLQKRNRLNDKR